MTKRKEKSSKRRNPAGVYPPSDSPASAACGEHGMGVAILEGAILLGPVLRKVRLQDVVTRIKPENMHGEQRWGKREGKEV